MWEDACIPLDPWLVALGTVSSGAPSSDAVGSRCQDTFLPPGYRFSPRFVPPSTGSSRLFPEGALLT